MLTIFLHFGCHFKTINVGCFCDVYSTNLDEDLKVSYIIYGKSAAILATILDSEKAKPVSRPPPVDFVIR